MRLKLCFTYLFFIVLIQCVDAQLRFSTSMNVSWCAPLAQCKVYLSAIRGPAIMFRFTPPRVESVDALRVILKARSLEEIGTELKIAAKAILRVNLTAPCYLDAEDIARDFVAEFQKNYISAVVRSFCFSQAPQKPISDLRNFSYSLTPEPEPTSDSEEFSQFVGDFFSNLQVFETTAPFNFSAITPLPSPKFVGPSPSSSATPTFTMPPENGKSNNQFVSPSPTPSLLTNSPSPTTSLITNSPSPSASLLTDLEVADIDDEDMSFSAILGSDGLFDGNKRDFDILVNLFKYAELHEAGHLAANLNLTLLAPMDSAFMQTGMNEEQAFITFIHKLEMGVIVDGDGDGKSMLRGPMLARILLSYHILSAQVDFSLQNLLNPVFLVTALEVPLIFNVNKEFVDHSPKTPNSRIVRERASQKYGILVHALDSVLFPFEFSSEQFGVCETR